MTYVFIFCIFLAATMLACIIADAKNIKDEYNKMKYENDLTVRKLNSDYHDKALELYLRYPRL